MWLHLTHVLHSLRFTRWADTQAQKNIIGDFCRSLSAVTSRQRLRSASRQLLDVPRYRLSSFARRAFSVAGPSAWNSLAEYLRDLAIGRNTVLEKCWRRFYLQCTNAYSALKVPRLCAIQIHITLHCPHWHQVANMTERSVRDEGWVCKNGRTDKKHMSYCNAHRAGASHRHRQQARKIWWRLNVWFLRYAHI